MLNPQIFFSYLSTRSARKNLIDKPNYTTKKIYKKGKFWINFFTTFICLIGSVNSKAANPQEVVVVPYVLKEYDFFETYRAVGQVKIRDSQYVAAKRAGTVEYVTALQGQKVKEGDLIISLNEKMAEQALLKAKADFKSVQSSYERDLSLYEKKIISNESINKSKVDLERSKLDLVTAQEEFEYFVVRAPFDGVIGVIRARVGDKIALGDNLFTIIRPARPKEVIVDLPPSLNGKINDSTEVYAIDLSQKKIYGKIIAISQYLSESGTFATKIEFPEDSEFLHDSFIETTITYNKHKAISVPERAVMKNNTGNFVYKIDENNVIKQVYVKLGTRTDNNIEIISDDLPLGSFVVLEGLTKVYEGIKVQVSSSLKDNIDTKDNSNSKNGLDSKDK